MFLVNQLQVLVISTVVSLVNCEFKLLVLHTNDMHSRFEETNAHSGQCVKKYGKCYGGFARIKAAIDSYKEKAKADGYNPIVLNAGDTYQGTVFYTMFKWEIVSDLMNMMGFDVLSLGNHEFDDGPEGLAPFISNSTTPIVCSNIDYSKEKALSGAKLPPSHVLEVGGHKVGVIGYLTPETKILSKTGDVTFNEIVPSIKTEAEKLKKDGINIIIAVGHAGYKVDQEIAQEVPDVDVVVGGHTNTFLYSGNQPDIEKIEGPYPTVITQSSGRKVLVTQAYAYTKYLGFLHVTFDDNGEVVNYDGNPILMTDVYSKNENVEAEIQKYAVQVKKKANKKIGSTKVFLEADERTCRTRECNFGNMITDALVHANALDWVGKGWTNAPIGLIQGGSLRASIDPTISNGDITYANLLTTLPFVNSVERLVISGDVLKRVLEHSVEGYDPQQRPGAFMQVSGLHVEYDMTQSPGERVKTVMVRCGACMVPVYEPLNLTANYVVLTSTFLADGGDGYSMFKEASQRTVLAITDVDTVQNYLAEKSPVEPEIQGRIILHGLPNSASSFYSGALTPLLCLTAYCYIQSSSYYRYFFSVYGR